MGLPRDLFGQMGRTIRCAHAVGAVEHSSHEDESLTRVSGLVGPRPPDVVIGGVRESVDMGHNGTDDDGNEDTGKDEETADVPDIRKDSVQEEYNATAHPGADDEAYKDMPRLRDEAGVHERIHGDSLLSQNGGHGRGPEDPGEAVPKSGEKPARATIFPSSDGGPVIDC